MTFSTIVLAVSLVTVVGMSAESMPHVKFYFDTVTTWPDDKPLVFAGQANVSNCHVPSLTGSGSANLNWVTVHGSTKHSGSFIADGGIFHGGLIINGSVQLSDAIVRQHTQIVGSLNATNTSFASIECAPSKKIVLMQCSADTITVKAQGYPHEQLLVELDDTRIRGHIVFEGAPGRVILRDGAQVWGKVINGTVKIK